MGLKQLKSIIVEDDLQQVKLLLNWVVKFSFLLHLLIFTGEFVFDFHLISVSSYLPVLLASSCIVILYQNKIFLNSLGFYNLLVFYLSFEVHFLLNPTIFYHITYWFAFIIIIAVTTGGIQQALIWLGVVLFTIFFDYWFLQNTLQLPQLEIKVSIVNLAVGGFIFIAGIFLFICLFHWILGKSYQYMKQKSVELEKLRDSIEQKKNILEKYQKAHYSLSGDPSILKGQYEKLYIKICKLVAKNMHISRVSIWMLDDTETTLNRMYLVNKGLGNSDWIQIKMNDYPAYLKALKTKKFIAAEDAIHHPDTSVFSEDYLKPLQIYSMLDTPFLIDGKLKGVICCENQYTIRQWTAADILFVQSLSDFISLSHKNYETQSLLQQIQSQNEELLEQRHEIEAINEKLSLLNETLEVKVVERTQELESQNKVLTEYAFINSHQLRAPLSRILGLSELISKKLADKSDIQLINALTKSTNELDIIINRISKLLYDGKDLNRDDIRELIEKELKKENS